jgi:hypothetical protein
MYFRAAIVYVFKDWLKLEHGLFDDFSPHFVEPPPPSIFPVVLRDGRGRVARFRP